MPFLASSYQSLPSKPGIYLFLDKKGKVLYIGKAKDLKKRVSSYFVNSVRLLEKTRILVSQVAKIETIEVSSEIEALLLEANYIKQYKPKYNARLADGKRYPLIRITIKDKYPKVLIARNTYDKKSLYFGPFPNSGAVWLVLKTIRRIFPFQSVINHPKKLCLYNHLGLCPCPGVSSSKDTPYIRSILHIIDFLNGNTKKVTLNLEKERNNLSIQEEFEKAEGIQKNIDAILYVTSSDFEKFDYKINPNLDADLRTKELLSLQACLVKHNVLVNRLERIECYDISNISGAHAAGSMVVFVNGEKDPSQYRKFRIRNLPNISNLSNDFAMMQQIISRRLKHLEWSYPDLIIVDGGKGQVSAAMKALYSSSERSESRSLNRIPVIGLAKREETIIIPKRRHSGSPSLKLRSYVAKGYVDGARKRGKRVLSLSKESASKISPSPLPSPLEGEGGGEGTSQNDAIRRFSEISLPKDSLALHLVMRIRDEAHRFAIFYHRKLRSKTFIS